MHRFCLIAELDRKLQITSRLAGCFQDYRQINRMLHPIEGLIAQRIYGLIMGYEDLNDHEELRHDTYYAGYCYAPQNIFCGKHLLAAKLRPSNVDPAAGALEELQRVIKQIRDQWSNVQILVRGDSAYSRDNIMGWCESQTGVDYVFGLAQNSRLIQMATTTQNRAKLEFEQKLSTVVSFLETVFKADEKLPEVASDLINNSTWYKSLDYQTRESWSHSRRVVCKVEYGVKGTNIRFVVTSITTDKMAPGELYTQKYCPRGEMENRFKEQQLELFSDRTSTHTFAGNQLRLWFYSIAYVLMNALRSKCLAKTELQNAQVGTIRTKLLKLGALITVSPRRILIAITSSCPYKHIFATAYRCFKLLPNTA